MSFLITDAVIQNYNKENRRYLRYRIEVDKEDTLPFLYNIFLPPNWWVY